MIIIENLIHSYHVYKQLKFRERTGGINKTKK
jgi:hypothetical protein